MACNFATIGFGTDTGGSIRNLSSWCNLYGIRPSKGLTSVDGVVPLSVHSGVYMQVTGPQFETPAEIRMYRSLGADTIAMSLADEVIAASHMHMKVCAINCISNMAAGMEAEGFSQGSIEESMSSVLQNFQILINGLLDTL